MPDPTEFPQRELLVVSCEVLRKGKKKGGGEWILYNVVVTGTDGIPIDKEFRSWSKLEASGQPQLFGVETGEYRGTPQYTLHPIRKMSLGERVEILEAQRIEQDERVARLENMVLQLQSGGRAPEDGPAPEAGQEGEPAADAPAAPAGGDGW